MRQNCTGIYFYLRACQLVWLVFSTAAVPSSAKHAHRDRLKHRRPAEDDLAKHKQKVERKKSGVASVFSNSYTTSFLYSFAWSTRYFISMIYASHCLCCFLPSLLASLLASSLLRCPFFLAFLCMSCMHSFIPPLFLSFICSFIHSQEITVWLVRTALTCVTLPAVWPFGCWILKEASYASSFAAVLTVSPGCRPGEAVHRLVMFSAQLGWGCTECRPQTPSLSLSLINFFVCCFGLKVLVEYDCWDGKMSCSPAWSLGFWVWRSRLNLLLMLSYSLGQSYGWKQHRLEGRSQRELNGVQEWLWCLRSKDLWKNQWRNPADTEQVWKPWAKAVLSFKWEESVVGTPAEENVHHQSLRKYWYRVELSIARSSTKRGTGGYPFELLCKPVSFPHGLTAGELPEKPRKNRMKSSRALEVQKGLGFGVLGLR